MRIERGDLFECGLPAIGHGCNTRGAMGAGIAVEFRRRWPEMYEAYRARCEAGAFQLGDVFVWESDPVVFNLATQPDTGPSASLEAIAAATASMLQIAADRELSAVGLPRIGAGLGGLDWDDVRPVLEAVADAEPAVELCIYEQSVRAG